MTDMETAPRRPKGGGGGGGEKIFTFGENSCGGLF